MAQFISQKIVSRIKGKGRGWIFSPKDFADCGSRKAIDININRLVKTGVIRHLLRGVYDYPRTSALFNAPANPEGDRIAQTIARKYGWAIYPSGETALNLLGLSSQVPGKYIYYSNGPSKKFTWSGGELIFKKRANKETGALSPHTALLVQALKALGEDNVDTNALNILRKKFSAGGKRAALREAQYVTGWVYEVIKKIAEKDNLNG